MKYIIENSIIEKCNNFAANVIDSNKNIYKRRNQSNIKKITSDISIGKIAEEYSFSIIRQYVEDISPPDYNIYSGKNKNWEPDLKSKNFNFSIKCQEISSAKKHGESWVFQLGYDSFDCDNFTFSYDIFNKNFVVFNLIDIRNKYGEIKAIVPIKNLHDNKLFKPVKVPMLRSTKVAVYYSDILSLNMNLSDNNLNIISEQL